MTAYSHFKKQGGLRFLFSLLRARVFLFSVASFLLLGTSKKSLELLRLGIQLKIQKRLRKKYLSLLKKLDIAEWKNLPHERSKKVWVCWLQGLENAPPIVQVCVRSQEKFFADYEYILLTEEMIPQYVTFPEHIVELREKKLISDAHFSDLLRLELLVKYGGIWLDATVFCAGERVPAYVAESELFLFQCLKPGADGHCLTISSWLIAAASSHPLLLATRHILYEYWKRNHSMADYFLFHLCFEIASEALPEERGRIPKVCNSTPHILQLEMREHCDENRFREILSMGCFHKLTYRLNLSGWEKLDG